MHFDIHTGGIDHLAIHHPNEIAQNYGATGGRVVNYWVHHEFLKVDNEKMSKSKGNFYTLKDLTDRGFEPLDLRYFILGTHYRKQINFTWEALESAQNARRRLYQKVMELGQYHDDDSFSTKGHTYVDDFAHALEDDVNIPQALAIMWDLLKDPHIENQEKIHMVATFDEVFGLDILTHSRLLAEEQLTGADVPQEVLDLAQRRSQLRGEKNFTEADRVRDQIRKQGFEVLDRTDNEFVVVPIESVTAKAE
jgi:cysteinyl-tRNA synthetase